MGAIVAERVLQHEQPGSVALAEDENLVAEGTARDLHRRNDARQDSGLVGTQDGLRALDVRVKLWPVPCEVPEPLRFTEDHRGDYDPDPVRRLWHILVSTESVMQQFRAGFLGKCSPVHFFWGSFDLAVTRFSGRPAPPRTDADAITREGYSHECSSAGFWPGGGAIQEPAFYSYTAPEPSGFEAVRVRPGEAFYSEDLGQFLYRYDDLRAAADPEKALLEFFQSTYEAGADRGGWDRLVLERPKA